MMYFVLQEDILKILSHTDETRRGLETLKRDRDRWDRRREKKDLTSFCRYLNRLESDVVGLLSDWTLQDCEDSRQKPVFPVFESLHDTFVKLNFLFKDLKQARTELNRAFIRTGSIEQLEVDWDRFCKVIEQLREYLLDGFLYKIGANILLSDGDGDDLFSTVH